MKKCIFIFIILAVLLESNCYSGLVHRENNIYQNENNSYLETITWKKNLYNIDDPSAIYLNLDSNSTDCNGTNCTLATEPLYHLETLNRHRDFRLSAARNTGGHINSSRSDDFSIGLSGNETQLNEEDSGSYNNSNNFCDNEYSQNDDCNPAPAPSPVPEPASIVLFGLGLSLMAINIKKIQKYCVSK